MTAKQIFTHPIAIFIYIAGVLTLIYGITQGWFGGKKKSKQQRCAEETGFNLDDLDPKAITTTMGMNRDKFEACMSRQPEGERCRTFHPEDAISFYSSPPPLDGIVKNGKCVGEEGADCLIAFGKKGKWKDGVCAPVATNTVDENNPAQRTTSSENETSRTSGQTQIGQTPSGFFITPSSNYRICNKDTWDDFKSRLHFNFQVWALQNAPCGNDWSKALAEIKGYLQQRAGLWQMQTLPNTIQPLQNYMKQNYPHFEMGLNVSKI